MRTPRLEYRNRRKAFQEGSHFAELFGQCYYYALHDLSTIGLLRKDKDFQCNGKSLFYWLPDQASLRTIRLEIELPLRFVKKAA